MVGLIYKTLYEWGEKSFCITDYNELINNAAGETDMNHYSIDRKHDHIAGLILESIEDKENLESFLRWCNDSDIPLFVIEYCNIKSDAMRKILWDHTKAYIEKLAPGKYINLESYETKLAFGLKPSIYLNNHTIT